MSGAREPVPFDELVVALTAHVDVAALSDVLVETLDAVLPDGMVLVERDTSLRDRLAKRRGRARSLTVTALDRVLTLELPENRPVRATSAHCVRGVILSRDVVPVPTWIDELAGVLEAVARENDSARASLDRLLFSRPTD